MVKFIPFHLVLCGFTALTVDSWIH